ncbi:TonB system transport protein ExbD [Peristeroidobacter soli]|uniref:TonB system transport protein ExbD n=1 Tax=Peristeroidobacter soli TaxID=2497877 RepID=UPI001C37D13B|nr:TonB system transport protein ExbD [Peristeroidobacter soli]
MAFKLDPGEGEDLTGLHEINVTPFIDVMLVLLIIFMVAAPLATVNVPLDLPVSSAQAKPEEQDPVIVSVQADLRISIGEREIARDMLPQALQRALGDDMESRIFLRADKGVSYGDLMGVMDDLRTAGFARIALVTLDKSGT